MFPKLSARRFFWFKVSPEHFHGFVRAMAVIVNQDSNADEHYELDEDRWTERMAARSWAILSLVVGGLLMVVAMLGTKSNAIYLMDKVVRLDYAGPFGTELDGASRVLTTMSLVQMLLFVGLLVVVTSLLGITATQGRHKCMAATYAFTSASLAAVMLMMSMQILTRIQVTQPLMARQVQHLCNSTTYIQLLAGPDSVTQTEMWV